MKPEVFIAIPDGRLKSHMFTEEWMKEIESIANVTWNPLGRDMTSSELAEAVKDKYAIITGWGSPKITSEVLANANKLRFVGHAAGTIRWLVDEDFFEKGIIITNANLALAPSVAEYCLMTLLMARWEILKTLDRVRNGLWQDNNDVVPGINGCTIGLIGYGVITECFIRLLKAFDVKIYVYSRHCPKEKAKELGFELCALEEALQCDVVSVHMTLTPETVHLIDMKKLSLIRDGAILMNTSRGRLIDEDALVETLESGRIFAILDVFRQEPLPADHKLRNMPNVITTPHSAGTSVYWRRKMAQLVLDDLKRVLAGETPVGIITLEKYRTMTPM